MEPSSSTVSLEGAAGQGVPLSEVASSPPDLSLVVPCHNEEDNVGDLYGRISEALPAGLDWEIIFIDDGSTDGTLDAIKAIRKADLRVRFRSFLRNYGHQQSLMAGLAVARGDLVMTLDGDLQHPPSYIPAFLDLQAKSGADVVSGRRRGAQRGFLKDLFSRGYYWLLSFLSDAPVVAGVSDFRLYTRRAVDLINSLNERTPFLRGLVKELRLDEVLLDYDPADRRKGAPSYTFGKSFALAMESFTKLTRLPVRLGLLLGSFGVILSLGQAFHYLVLRLFTNHLVPGQADAMVLLGLTSGSILLLLSLVLHHVSVIVSHLQNWPRFVVKEEEVSSDE